MSENIKQAFYCVHCQSMQTYTISKKDYEEKDKIKVKCVKCESDLEIPIDKAKIARGWFG